MSSVRPTTDFSADFGLSQIYPILDPTTDDELQVVHTSICDPFVVTVQDDQSIHVLQIDADGELQEVEKGTSLSSDKIVSACLYRHASQSLETALLWVLDVNGGLHVCLSEHSSISPADEEI